MSAHLETCKWGIIYKKITDKKIIIKKHLMSRKSKVTDLNQFVDKDKVKMIKWTKPTQFEITDSDFEN